MDSHLSQCEIGDSFDSSFFEIYELVEKKEPNLMHFVENAQPLALLPTNVP